MSRRTMVATSAARTAFRPNALPMLPSVRAQQILGRKTDRRSRLRSSAVLGLNVRHAQARSECCSGRCTVEGCMMRYTAAPQRRTLANAIRRCSDPFRAALGRLRSDRMPSWHLCRRFEESFQVFEPGAGSFSTLDRTASRRHGGSQRHAPLRRRARLLDLVRAPRPVPTDGPLRTQCAQQRRACNAMSYVKLTSAFRLLRGAAQLGAPEATHGTFGLQPLLLQVKNTAKAPPRMSLFHLVGAMPF